MIAASAGDRVEVLYGTGERYGRTYEPKVGVTRLDSVHATPAGDRWTMTLPVNGFPRAVVVNGWIYVIESGGGGHEDGYAEGGDALWLTITEENA